MGHARLLGLHCVQRLELALHTFVRDLPQAEATDAGAEARRSGLRMVRQLDLRMAAVVPLDWLLFLGLDVPEVRQC